MALIQIFTAIDERVRYPQDSGIPVEKFAFGLFTRWVPEDVPLESDMPNLAISPSADHRVQDSEDSSIADAPRTQIEAAQRRTVITPSESEVRSVGSISLIHHLTLDHKGRGPRCDGSTRLPGARERIL